MFYDPDDHLGKFCPICGREHFNEGDLCTRCRDRFEMEDPEYDYE